MVEQLFAWPVSRVFESNLWDFRRRVRDVHWEPINLRYDRLFGRRDLLASPGAQIDLGRFHTLVPELLLCFAHVCRVGLVGARLGRAHSS
jgi:hypothetical protein